MNIRNHIRHWAAMLNERETIYGESVVSEGKVLNDKQSKLLNALANHFKDDGEIEVNGGYDEDESIVVNFDYSGYDNGSYARLGFETQSKAVDAFVKGWNKENGTNFDTEVDEDNWCIDVYGEDGDYGVVELDNLIEKLNYYKNYDFIAKLDDKEYIISDKIGFDDNSIILSLDGKAKSKCKDIMDAILDVVDADGTKDITVKFSDGEDFPRLLGFTSDKNNVFCANLSKETVNETVDSSKTNIKDVIETIAKKDLNAWVLDKDEDYQKNKDVVSGLEKQEIDKFLLDYTNEIYDNAMKNIDFEDNESIRKWYGYLLKRIYTIWRIFYPFFEKMGIGKGNPFFGNGIVFVMDYVKSLGGHSYNDVDSISKKTKIQLPSKEEISRYLRSANRTI